MGITNEERDLVFEIADGNPHLIQFIGHMRIISEDAKDVSYMDILKWMRMNGYKGCSLISWIKEKHQDSILNAIADLRRKTFKDFKVRKIFANKVF